MNPDDITLEDLSKNFEYTKACIEIDSINDIESLKEISKAYMKLYMKQQEVLIQMGSSGML
jgi:hypothetical protein